MTASVLIIAAANPGFCLQVAAGLEEKGYQAKTVSNIGRALARLDCESFDVVLFSEGDIDQRSAEFFWGFYNRPLGTVTPLIWLGPNETFRHPFPMRNLLDQYFCANRIKPPDLVRFVQITDKMNQMKVKKGNLAVVQPGRVLAASAAINYSGALIFEQDEQKTAVYLDTGQICWATSNHPQGTLAHFLAAKQILGFYQMPQSGPLSMENEKAMLQQLLEEGEIKEELLNALILEYQKETLFRLLSWQHGSYSVLKAVHVQQKQIQVIIEVGDFLANAIRFRLTSDQVKELLGDQSRYPLVAAQATEALKQVKLLRPEKEILLLMSGELNFSELAGVMGQTQEDFERHCLLLLSLNLCQIRHRAQNGKKPTSSPEALAQSAPASETDSDWIEKTHPDIGRQIADALAKPPPGELSAEKTVIDDSSALADRADAKAKMRTATKLKRGSGRHLKISLLLLLLLPAILYAVHWWQKQTVPKADEPLYAAHQAPIRVVKKQPVAVQNAAVSQPTARAKPAVAVPKQEVRKPVAASKKTAAKASLKKVAVAAPKAKKPAPAKRRRKVPTLDPTFPRDLKRAKEEIDASRYREAADQFEGLLRRKPKNLEAMQGRAEALFHLNRMDEAKAIYLKIVRYSPDAVEAHLRLGSIYLIEGNPEEARKSYQRFLTKAGDHPFAEEVHRILLKLK